jgi:hypothetical protein
MTILKAAQTDRLATEHIAKAVASWENEGGAPSPSGSDKATSWFVPPLVVPVLLIALIVARLAYQAYS